MDRPIVYPGQQAADTDVLSASKFALQALAYFCQTVLGTSVVVDGLACTPGTGLNVSIAAGSIYALGATDAFSYGSLGTDTNQIVKQGLNLAPLTLAVPAPGTAGQSINYLIEARYQDVDSNPVALAYYDSANPSVPYTGPNNTGVAQNTVRQGVCSLQAKAGTAATTGSQTTPAADAGWTGLFVVTVANGASSIVGGNISQLASAPFIGMKLPQVWQGIQAQLGNWAQDTGTANAGAVTLSPAPASLAALKGVPLRILKSAAANTGAYTLNVNGLGAVTVNFQGGALLSGDLLASAWYSVMYDGTIFELVNPPGNGRGGAPSGSAGGVLAGSYPSPTFAAAATLTVLSNLTGGTAAPVFNTLAAFLTALGIIPVTNSGLATMAAGTVKANATGSSATPTDVTFANFLTDLGFAVTSGSSWLFQIPNPAGGSIIVQGGFVAGADDAEETVTFPVAFPTSCDWPGATISATSLPSSGTDGGCYARVISRTQMACGIMTDGGATINGLFWIAVGH